MENDGDAFVPRRYGKYTVTGELGRGGTGVVYRAEDPDLERPIAVKVLRRATAGSLESDRARTLREAKALANLSHPNLVPVYDVGDAGGELFVAMELVEGGSLTAWKTGRSTAEVLKVFIAAGRGLQAAHAAGFVHRDFKPSNVLVEKDGKARVTDFGLARPPHAGREAPEPVSMEASLETELTPDGIAVGTPAYMAPEQHERRVLSPAADQFAFCVALHEALYGARPFTGERLYRDKLEGQPPTPKRPDVPGRIARAIQKGMAPAPAGRHASMDILLRELEQDPTMWRRRVVVLGAVGGLAVGAWAWGQLGDPPSPCAFEASAFDGVWDEAVAQEVRTAFVAAGQKHGSDAFERLSERLDLYEDDWVKAREDACEATRVRAEQTEVVREQRVACLEHRRDAAKALTVALARIQGGAVHRFENVVLPSIGVCNDVEAVAAREPHPKVEELRTFVLEGDALRQTGRFKEATALLTERMPAVRERKHGPLLAEALTALGVALDEQGRHDDAEAAMTEAVWTAQASGYDEGVVAAAHQLAIGPRGQDRVLWAQLAESTAARLGAGARRQAALVATYAAALREQGRFEAAAAEYERGLEILEAEGLEAALDAASALHGLAAAEHERGRHGHARSLLEQAVGIREAIQGDDHPETISLRDELRALQSDREAAERLASGGG